MLSCLQMPKTRVTTFLSKKQKHIKQKQIINHDFSIEDQREMWIVQVKTLQPPPKVKSVSHFLQSWYFAQIYKPVILLPELLSSIFIRPKTTLSQPVHHFVELWSLQNVINLQNQQNLVCLYQTQAQSVLDKGGFPEFKCNCFSIKQVRPSCLYFMVQEDSLE